MTSSSKKFNGEAINPKLINTLKKWFKITEATGSQAKNRERIQAYWNIGKELITQKQTSRGFLVALADQTNSSYTALRRCRHFYEIWPRGLTGDAKNLSWSHQIYLMKIDDKKIRDYYIQESIRQGWDRDSLAHAIKNNYYDKPESEKQLPKVKPQFIDPLHVYPADFLGAIDGDTFKARLDTGFDMSVTKSLRLRGINTAEMGTKAHRNKDALAAKEFITQKLENCARIIIKTHKTDIYGRFLADVYYHPTLTKKEDILKHGFYLNQQLLDEGLARPMMG